MYDKCIGLREEKVWLGWAAGGRLSFARTWLAAFMLVCACADVECPRADEVVAVEQAIVGGGSRPRSVSLSAAQQNAIVALTDSHHELLCTATLISSSWALTAKHCQVGADAKLALDGLPIIRQRSRLSRCSTSESCRVTVGIFTRAVGARRYSES